MKKNHGAEAETVETAVSDALRFTKRQLLKKYADRADILGVILRAGAEYTVAEAEALLCEFMKGKVKG